MSHSTTSYAALQQLDFYPDILGSLSGFMEFMHSKNFCGLGKKITEIYASGFLTAKTFRAEQFMPPNGDDFFDLKQKYLEAVELIHTRFGDRLPHQSYDTLAFMALRSDPTKEERIPDVAHLLPGGMNWKTADAVYHALPLCSRLYFDVQTAINAKTGRVLGHGCGCDHSLASMPTCIVNAPMGDSTEIMLEETESFLRHVLGQCFLLHFGLPQGMGASVKMNLHDLRRRPTTANRLVLKQSAHH